MARCEFYFHVVFYSICCADCRSLFVCMSHNVLHDSQSTLNMFNSQNCRCCAISTKSQRHTAYILWPWLEKCSCIIVGIAIYCRLRYVVSGPRCCFSTMKLCISGIFGSFSKMAGALQWDSWDGLFFSLCFSAFHVWLPARMHRLAHLFPHQQMRLEVGPDCILISSEYGINY